MSATPDSTLADSEQLIADLQRQLAECRAERDEGLQRETATAEVLQVINSSPGDLGPVFDAMLEKACRLCGAVQGALWLIDGERTRLAAARGLSADFVRLLRERGEATPTPPLQRVMRGERIVHYLDTEGSGLPFEEAAIEADVRTLIWVALEREDTPLGAFAIARREVRAFSEKEIALLQNFAAQAVIALENARLVTETREALEQQTATAEVLGIINSSPGDLAPVFDAILEKAHSLCGAAHGDLTLEEGDNFRAVAMRGLPEAFAEVLRRPFPRRDFHERLLGGCVHIADLAAAEFASDSPVYRAAIGPGAVRTLLVVPLRKGGRLLGYITANRQEVRPFSDKQIALLENFAAQAVIAMENARLLTETREALEQQTATAEVLQVINSSPGDLAPVFDAILEKAHSLCGAMNGALGLYDGEKIRAVAVRAFSAAWAERLREGVPAGGNPIVEPLLNGARFVQIDMAELAHPLARAAVELTGVHTALTVPLRKDGVLLGTITAVRQEVRPFTDKQIALLENFAAQAVIAMENARLLGELRRRTRDLQESLEYQTATSDVLKVISRSTFDLQPVLDTVVETAVRLCSSDTGAIWIREGEVYRYMSFSAVKTEPEYHAALRQRTIVPGRDTSIAARVALEGRVVHVEDIRADPDYALPGTVASGRRTMLGVPLLRDSEPIGVIALSRKRGEPFSERQIELVRTFADQAVIAMENARLLGELRQRTEEVAELNRGLEARVAEQVEELGRVGRLKRFLAPQLAELIVSQGDEKILESHRREIVVVFCDLRGYTAFTETAEPEEVLKFLREYHGALGPLVSQFEGTLDQFSGDGIMVFFNDPVPCPDPAERAVKMAMAMREEAGKLIAAWRRHGCELGFGAGIAQGYATLGQIGFSERSGYTAIGTVCNLAARHCAEAKDGQILVSSHIAEAVEAVAKLEDLGNLELKGLRRPVAAFNVAQSTSAADARPNLTVVASGPGA